MASIINTQKVKITVLSHGTCRNPIDCPGFIVLLTKLFLIMPFGCKGPCFTTTPVADPVLVSRVDKHLHVSVVKKTGDLRHQIEHPVTKQERVHHHVALAPTTAINA